MVSFTEIVNDKNDILDQIPPVKLVNKQNIFNGARPIMLHKYNQGIWRCSTLKATFV